MRKAFIQSPRMFASGLRGGARKASVQPRPRLLFECLQRSGTPSPDQGPPPGRGAARTGTPTITVSAPPRRLRAASGSNYHQSHADDTPRAKRTISPPTSGGSLAGNKAAAGGVFQFDTAAVRRRSLSTATPAISPILVLSPVSAPAEESISGLQPALISPNRPRHLSGGTLSPTFLFSPQPCGVSPKLNASKRSNVSPIGLENVSYSGPSHLLSPSNVSPTVHLDDSPTGHSNVSPTIKPRMSPKAAFSSPGNCDTPDNITENSRLTLSAVASHFIPSPCKGRGQVSPNTCHTLEAALANVTDKSRLSWTFLNRGGFGTAFFGRNHTTGQRLVVKRIHSYHSRSTNDETVNSESNALLLSPHPNIVQTLSIFHHGDDSWVVMEYGGNVSLDKLIQTGKENLPFRYIVRYSSDIASALEYCHRKRLLHLDVKPANVLVDTTRHQCKLCDFGCSTRVPATTTDESLADALSVAGRGSTARQEKNGTAPAYRVLQGTLAYRAPELLRGGHEPTPAADVYSLGVTMWEMWSGETPYRGIDKHVVTYRVVKHGLRPDGTTVPVSSSAGRQGGGGGCGGGKAVPAAGGGHEKAGAESSGADGTASAMPAAVDAVNANPILYPEVFVKCWQHNPGQRPTAAQVGSLLSRVRPSLAPTSLGGLEIILDECRVAV